MVLHNPNNWHWVDKNCIEWAKTYFGEKGKEVSETTEISNNPLKLAINELKSLEGDCGVYQRKGKVISLFDMKLIYKYTGTITEPNEEGENDTKETKVTGEITVPEVAYDTEKDEYQFEISTITGPSNSVKDDVRGAVRKEIIPKLRDLFASFGKELLRVHGSEIQHPVEEVKSQFTKSNQQESISDIHSSEKKKSDNVPAAAVTSAASSSTPAAHADSKPKVAEYNTETADTEITFHAPASELYATFIQLPRVGAWTRSPPVYTPAPSSSGFPSVGTKYALFGGNISGEFLELQENKLIKQTWRLKDWRGSHHATLTLKFTENVSEGDTAVKVHFDGIPLSDGGEVLQNFERYYTQPIKVTFGFGALL